MAVLLWAWSRGTEPRALLDALFAFRLRAGEVMATDPERASGGRAPTLLGRCLFTGQAALVVLVLTAPFVRRFRTPVSVALAATVIFASASILLGGSWWNHYLVQLSVPLAVGCGLIAARTRLVVPAVVTYTTASALLGAFVLLPRITAPDAATTTGRAVAVAAQPGDTIVNAWGRPDLVRASGLPSPYEHLWSLPVRTDDADLAELGALLAGPNAPTWLVTRRTLASWGMDTSTAQRIVERRYRQVGEVCGRRVLVRADVGRVMPVAHIDHCG